MNIKRLIMGCFVPCLSAILVALIATVVINSELLMFNRRNENILMLVLICPALIETAFFMPWYIIKAKGTSRNKKDLQKSGVMVCIPSVAISCLLLFGLASFYTLWEEGSLFLVIASILYALTGVIQYLLCTPY